MVHPDPLTARDPIVGLELVPPRVAAAYRESLETLNAQMWGSTATACRRTLEGTLADKLGDKREKYLHQNISKLPGAVDLGKPLVEISDALRRGGNLGAHFDSDRDPTPGMARQMVELMEYLLEYLYVLPGQIEQLKAHVEGDDGNGGAKP